MAARIQESLTMSGRCALALLVPFALASDGQAPAPLAVREPAATVAVAELRAPAVIAPTSWVENPEEERVYREAVIAAMAYLEAHRSPRTGLVRATQGWGNITLWDIGSLIGAVYAAGELDLLSAGERDAWMGTLLETLRTAPLFDDAAFNRVYVAATGRMVDQRDRPSDVGSGWSTTDLGRLLIWLKVVEARMPAHAEVARAVVARMDFDRIVRGGYLYGTDLQRGKLIDYPEGRLGYEQYAARGFELWGQVPHRALDPLAHAEPIEVMGHRLMQDERGDDKLTSEPFMLMGMELGWDSTFADFSRALLAVQEERYKRTGRLTMVSEDAVEVAPWFFYYYTVYSDGEEFAVRAQGPVQNGPRWVSAKAAYAWHALLPSEYTWRVVQAVAPARGDAGWSSGVFEGGGRSTGVRNLNTAAVILEAALYRKLGRPILSDS